MDQPSTPAPADWILLVEDHRDTADAVGILLSGSGFGVEAAPSGRTGLAILRNRPWAAILVDLHLPDISGLEVLGAIKASSPLTPVIVMTGNGTMASAVRAVNEAAFAYLEKPLDHDLLLLTLRRALEHKRSEEARRRLAAIVESSADAIVGTTLDGTIVAWNGGAERLYGYATPEAVGRRMSMLIPPDRVDDWAELLARLRRGHVVGEHETLRLRKDGARIDVSLTISLIRDATGGVVGASTIARDISARKRAEESTRALATLSQELVDTLDVAQVTERIAATVLRLFGARRAALLRLDQAGSALTYVATAGDDEGQSMRGRQLAPREGLAGLAVAAGQPVSTADIFTDARIILPDWLADRIRREGLRTGAAVPLVDRQETLGALTLGDTPHRVFTENDLRLLSAFAAHATVAIRNARLYEAVRQGRDFLQSIAENSADGIVTTDIHGRLTYVSPGAVRMFGYAPSEVLGRPVARYYQSGRREAGAMGRRLRDQGQVRNHETAVRAKDGRAVPVSVSLSLLRDAAGAVTGTLGVMRDMSEHHAAEAARREVAQLRAVNLLSGGVAHEVNNPLGVVVGQLELLEMGLAPETREAHRVRQALEAAREIKAIVTRMAHITRIETASWGTDLPPILDIRRSSEAS
jgi:PAS domain S-box-containing protein